MNRIELLRDNLPNIFNYSDALEALAPLYKAPHKVIQHLEKSGEILRLKRGVYGFCEGFDPLVAANLLYQPSYVSYQTALSFYGLIPERVEVIISVVDGRTAKFMTPAGPFLYRSQQSALYTEGMTMDQSAGINFLIATPEKAVLDTLARANLKAQFMTEAKVMEYLVEGLRIDLEVLAGMSVRRLKRLAKLYHNKAPIKLVGALTRCATQ